MKKVRWGVLSTAGIAQKEQIPAFLRSNNALVTAIATGSRIDKAIEVAKRFGIEKTYDSYEKLLDDPDIDAVYIPLPNHLHKKWVIAAAKKGKHILCEKPAAISVDEVLEMEKACNENGVLFMEAFMFYFHPQHARVKEIIDSGEIGDVSYMQAGFSFYLDEERRKTSIKMSDETGGGSIYDVGCYAIHSLRNILGAEPGTVHVHAVMDPEFHIDTDAVGYLTFQDGVRATFDCSFNLAARNEYKVFGTEGTITVPRAYRPDKNGGDGLIIVETNGISRTETLNDDQYRNQIEHLSAAILDGQDHVKHDFVNTVNNMRVIDACMESIKTGNQVKLS
ncbi:Gfo/Idh/MocA family protein [Sporosarcina jiandibaonis]|uniref:Gfo/Idh/MocA family protein n=1 Tax=Sporosarcina jiandibaonis TaxID=2715535 RepID=UPI001553197E|nr:Gfo/Idh/MocA family oxidoreductase [Sporosarcina jiandibaonis]